MLEKNYLTQIGIGPDAPGAPDYTARLPAVRGLLHGGLALPAPVTFFVGENGTGKSTLLEAVAVAAGFNPEGGTVNFNFASRESHSGLHRRLRLTRGVLRPRDGFFLRAESFYNVASEVERLDGETPMGPRLVDSYGGRPLHEQSHGESFMALVQNRFGGNGLYILDEPEAALSPARQLALLAEMGRLVRADSQLIVSTHSPILMAYPGAVIYELSDNGVARVPYEQTGHYRLTKQFIEAPGRMVRYLFEDEDEPE